VVVVERVVDEDGAAAEVGDEDEAGTPRRRGRVINK